MKLIPITLLVLGMLLLSTGAYAKDNFCGECHTSGEVAAFGKVMDYDKSIYQVKDTRCPGLIELKKGAYFTDSWLIKYNKDLTLMEEQTRRYPEYIREDIDRGAVSFADLKDVQPTSIDGVAGPNLKIKKGVHGVYETMNKLREDYRLEKVVGLGLVCTMLLMLLFSFGLKNTLKE